MLRLFNSLQITAGFVLGPFVIWWLHISEWPGATAVEVIAIIVEVILFLAIFIAVATCEAWDWGK